MPRQSAAPPVSRTIAANRFKLGTVRAGFALGSRLLPQRTVHRAGQLFATPFASSRQRALNAPQERVRLSTKILPGLQEPVTP